MSGDFLILTSGLDHWFSTRDIANTANRSAATGVDTDIAIVTIA